MKGNRKSQKQSQRNPIKKENKEQELYQDRFQKRRTPQVKIEAFESDQQMEENQHSVLDQNINQWEFENQNALFQSSRLDSSKPKKEQENKELKKPPQIDRQIRDREEDRQYGRDKKSSQLNALKNVSKQYSQPIIINEYNQNRDNFHQMVDQMDENMHEIKKIMTKNLDQDHSQFVSNTLVIIGKVNKRIRNIQKQVGNAHERIARLQGNLNENTNKQPEKNKGIKKQRKRRKANQIQRKYPCPYEGCPKAFGSSSSLSNHEKTKHQKHRKNKQKPPLKTHSRLLVVQPQFLEGRQHNMNQQIYEE